MVGGVDEVSNRLWPTPAQLDGTSLHTIQERLCGENDAPTAKQCATTSRELHPLGHAVFCLQRIYILQKSAPPRDMYIPAARAVPAPV